MGQKTIRKEIFFLLIVTIAALFANYFNSLGLLLITFILVVIKVLSNKIEMNIYLIFFLIPNIRMFDKVGNTFLVNSIFFIVMIKYIFINRKKINLKILLFALIFLIIELSHYFITKDLSVYFGMISWISAFILCAACLIDKSLIIDNKLMFWYLSGGIFASTIIVFFSNSMFYTLRFIDYGLRFKGLAGDPNYFSMYILIAIFSIANIQKRDPKKKKLYMFAFFTLSIIGLTTLSKMYILTFGFLSAISIIYVFFSFNKKNKSERRFVLMVSFLGVFVISIMFPFFSNLLQSTLDRFFIDDLTVISAESISRITSGRGDIVAFYLGELTNNIVLLIFGYGISYHKLFGIHMAHNTYLDFILSWGVIGSVIFFAILFVLYKIYRKNSYNERNIYSYLPMIAFLIVLFALSSFDADMFFFMIAYVVLQTGNKVYLENN